MNHRVIGLSLVLLGISALGVVGCSGGARQSLPLPAQRSELYYLHWLEHGSYPQRAASARALMDQAAKKEYVLLRYLYDQHAEYPREEALVKRMILLSLFDMNPDEYRVDVVSLMTYREEGMDGEWVKTGEEFDGVPVDFYFHWAGEAALRLVAKGYADDKSFEYLISYAGSYYPDDRRKAAAALSLFQGIPSYDPLPQPRTINDQPQIRRQQLHDIADWYQRNKASLHWDQSKRLYTSRKD